MDRQVAVSELAHRIENHADALLQLLPNRTPRRSRLIAVDRDREDGGESRNDVAVVLREGTIADVPLPEIERADLMVVDANGKRQKRTDRAEFRGVGVGMRF